MKVKVCGMKDLANIHAVAALRPDFMGFIFYPKSPRCADPSVLQETVLTLDNGINKVGVFVDQPLVDVIRIGQKLQLDFLQLHGNESPDYVRQVKAAGFAVIKVFSMGQSVDWNQVEAYTGLADFFLFDTKTPQHGGSGVHFDWSLLAGYSGDTPFFLSGGIQVADLQHINALDLPQLQGIDVNSRLEIRPGLKDVDRVQQLLKSVQP